MITSSKSLVKYVKLVRFYIILMRW
jgi:hypothetical protein